MIIMTMILIILLLSSGWRRWYEIYSLGKLRPYCLEGVLHCCSARDLPIHLTRYSRDHHYHQRHRHHHVFSSWCRSPMYNCAGAIISSFVILVPLRLVCSWFYQKCKDAFLSDIILVVCGNFSIYSPNTMPNLPEGMRLGGENLLVFITNQPTPPPLFNMSANT